MKYICHALLIGLLASIFPTIALSADSEQLAKQRQLFKHASNALQTHQLNVFRPLRAELADYPLAGYLDYLYLQNRLSQVSEQTLRDFFAENEGTFYADRLRASWLDRLASQKAWSSYLEFYQGTQPASRQCLKAQALIATGNQAQAQEMFEQLWLVNQSQHDNCDPVFQHASREGWLTDDLRWQRLMLTLRAQQFSLAKFLARSVNNSSEAEAWVQRWESIHENPLSLLNQLPAEPPRGNQISLARDLPLSREILVHGITRLARQNPEQAFEVWQRLSPHYNFDQSQYEHVRREAGKWSALKREDAALGLFGEVGDEPWKVRAALWQQNWPAVQDAIQSLNEEERQLNRWQYWLARSEAELGRYESAQAIYARIAGERDFYSFMAADRLEQPYQMNHNPIPSDAATMQAFRQNIEVRRLEEFVHLNLDLDARRQIFRLTQTFTPEQLQLLAVITHDMQWHHQTIAILGRARYWDALDLRFPVLYQAPMQRAAEANRLDSSWLLAIARQESAFQERVRSHAGAMGLMQVMPDTGRAVAKRLNDPLKNVNELNQPERNIQLGSAYLRQMLDRNQNNPILATAAYNAGPHRIDRWLPEQTLPADIWIENIPFNETRRYVRAVMSYAAIYDYQQQLEITPLKQRMPAVQAKKP